MKIEVISGSDPRVREQIELAGLNPDSEDFLCLFHDSGEVVQSLPLSSLPFNIIDGDLTPLFVFLQDGETKTKTRKDSWLDSDSPRGEITI